MHDTVVFAGPTLSIDEAKRLLHAEFLPPVCRGDLDRLPASTRFVGIIDGEFHQRLAVSPKEILKGLARGLRIFGASSMGALRAAETHRFGMVGVGRVFEQFRDGLLDADDEVALVYEPGTYRALSDPMVNLREALERAQQTGFINDEERDELTAAMKARYFPQRSWRALEQLCPALRSFAESHELPDVKRSDARALLLALSHARQVEQAKVGA